MTEDRDTPRAHLALLTQDPELVRDARALFRPASLRVVALRDLARAEELLSTRYLEILAFDERVGSAGFEILRSLSTHDDQEEPTFRVALCAGPEPAEPDLATLCHCAVARTRLDRVLHELGPFLDGQRPPCAASASVPAAENEDALLELTPEPLPVVEVEAPEEVPATASDSAPDAPAADSTLDNDTRTRPPSTLLERSPDLSSFLAEIDRRHTRMANQSYFDLLDVPRDATAAEIRAVFDVASLRFHPDRNRGLPDTNAVRKVAMLYAALSEAYDVLTSDDRRRRYERALDRGELKLDAPTRAHTRLLTLSQDTGARRFLRLAERAIEDGDEKSAALNLKFACDLDPDNPQLDAALREWQIPRDRE